VRWYCEEACSSTVSVVIHICDNTTERVKKPPRTYCVNTTVCLSNRSDKMNKKLD